MAIDLKMPALSPTMEEGTLAKWLVKEGDTIAPGEGSRSAAPRTPETVTRSSPHVARVEK